MSTKRLLPFVLAVIVVPGFGVGANAAEILFLSSMDAAHLPGDNALQAFMEKMGHTVTLLDDNTADADMRAAAAKANLVFISESVGSANVRNKITAVNTPMVITESWAWDEMGLTSGAGGGQNAVTPNIQIVASGHPLAAGLTGSIPVFTALTGARGAARFGNGIAGKDATVIARATLTDGLTYDVLFVYDKGATLAVAPADGSPQVAAHIRIGLGLDEQSYLVWHENAYALLKAAINYGLGALSDPGLATNPEPADGALAVQVPLFRWKASRSGVLHHVYLGKEPNLGPADLAGPSQTLTMWWYQGVLEPGATYYWRVDEVEADGVTTHTGIVWSFTVQALTAYHPTPTEGATDVAPTPTLAWLPGQAAVKHHLYLSSDREAVSQGSTAADKGELADCTFAPSGLEAATAYYWRVDETAPGSSVRSGPVWSFTTYLPVDDFESYTDQKDQEIFFTWIDGYNDKSSGSVVGHLEAPFAEQTIVHAGKQSMPVDYNNVRSPFYSEVKRVFTPAQDWTVNGVSTLVLSVRGKPTNSPAPLYLEAEDTSGHTAVVTCPDAKAVTAAVWTDWKIPRADLAGVNATKIKRVSLRIGTKGSTTPGGAGQLYVDDLRVIKAAPAGQ